MMKPKVTLKKTLSFVLTLVLSLGVLPVEGLAPVAMAAALTSETKEWSGYLEAEEDLTIEGDVTVTGDTNLVIAEGKTLTVKDGSFVVNEGFTLTVEGPGNLVIIGKMGWYEQNPGHLSILHGPCCGFKGNLRLVGGYTDITGGEGAAFGEMKNNEFNTDGAAGFDGKAVLFGGRLKVSGGLGGISAGFVGGSNRKPPGPAYTDETTITVQQDYIYTDGDKTYREGNINDKSELDQKTLEPVSGGIPKREPVITKEPKDITLLLGYTAGNSFSVKADIQEKEVYDLSYSWYKSTTESGDGEPIEGADSPDYVIPEGKKGGTLEYYYCMVTAKRKGFDIVSRKRSKTAKLFIDKFDPVVIPPKPREGLIDNGREQELISIGMTLNGTIYYAVTAGNAPELSEYSTMIPKRSDAGTYTVWYYVKGDENYKDTPARSFRVVIEKNEDPFNDKMLRAFLSRKSYTYDGKVHKPTVMVTYDGVIIEPKDYSVKYSKMPKNAGTYTVKVTVTKGAYKGKTASVSFNIAKAANTIKALKKTMSAIPYKKIKAKTQSVAVSKLIKVTNAKGKVTYTALSCDPGLKFDSKTKKFTIKKGSTRKSYSARIKVTDGGGTNYESSSKTLTVKINVSNVPKKQK